eukprot:scaffold2980_cov236-Pinguiococcus_pyrenoidosus.AAC.8
MGAKARDGSQVHAVALVPARRCCPRRARPAPSATDRDGRLARAALVSTSAKLGQRLAAKRIGPEKLGRVKPARLPGVRGCDSWNQAAFPGHERRLPGRKGETNHPKTHAASHPCQPSVRRPMSARPSGPREGRANRSEARRVLRSSPNWGFKSPAGSSLEARPCSLAEAVESARSVPKRHAPPMLRSGKIRWWGVSAQLDNLCAAEQEQDDGSMQPIFGSSANPLAQRRPFQA